jgi:predicted Zn-dependent protease
VASAGLDRSPPRLANLGEVSAPQIEFLWWEGCPSTDRALGELREALADVGMDGTGVRTREIKTDQDAAAAGFRGSPTILIEGVDVAGAQPDEPTGLTCRVYRRRDGRISPTPDPDDLRESLRRAAARTEVGR